MQSDKGTQINRSRAEPPISETSAIGASLRVDVRGPVPEWLFNGGSHVAAARSALLAGQDFSHMADLAWRHGDDYEPSR